ncbi:MAG: hypothetical protein JNM13_01690 [Hyphomicrobiaceae bacterium]|nr:hypothetical protein [Hyphomicrobiaceae bacterium]
MSVQPVAAATDSYPRFCHVWRPLLPVAGGLAAIALGGGVVSTGAWPAWVFAVGLLIGGIGMASLVSLLVIKGRRAAAVAIDAVEDKIEAVRQDLTDGK